MDFSFTSDQEELRGLANRVLTDRCTPEHLKEVAFGEGSTGVDLDLWRELAELGLVGIGLPESAGGGGLGFAEIGIVLEEVGRAVAPVPALPVMAMAGPFLAQHAPDRLEGLASGERIVMWDRDSRLDMTRPQINSQLIRAARIVHVDDEDQEAAIAAALIANDNGVLVTSDIERITPRTRDLINAVTIAIFAPHMLFEITGETDPEKALRALRTAHAPILCVTLGQQGSVMLDDNENKEAAE